MKDPVTPHFVRHTFELRSRPYRLVAFRLKGEPVSDTPTDKLEETFRRLVHGDSVSDFAEDVCSFDTPPLLYEELKALCQAFMNYVVFDTEEHFAKIIEHALYCRPDFEDYNPADFEELNFLEYGSVATIAEQWKERGLPPYGEFEVQYKFDVEVSLEDYEFTREGLVLKSKPCRCAFHKYYVHPLVLTAFPIWGRKFTVASHEPTTEQAKRWLDRFNECLDYVVDNRSEQLKMALVSEESKIEKRNRRFFEEQQKGELTNKDIGIHVAKEFGEVEPYTEGTVRNGATEHREKYCPTEPSQPRRRGRPSKAKDS